MKYILEGNPKEVAKVIQENRIRVERGQISFVLVPNEEEATDSKDIALAPDEENNEVTDSKDVLLDDTKVAPTKATKRSKKSE